MICPYCNDNSPYTWRRYWRSTASRVRCTACGHVFKVSPTRRDLGVGIGILVLLILTPIVLHFLFGLPLYVLLIAIAGFPAQIYFDRVMETRGTPRALKNHSTQQGAAPKGDPAPQDGNSGGTKGPPSVS